MFKKIKIYWFPIIFIFFVNASYSQLNISKVSNHKIVYSFENLTDSIFGYFETDCFYILKSSYKTNNVITLQRHRSNLRNDTLFLFLHDIDFHDYTTTKNVDYNDYKRKGLWGYKKLILGTKSKLNLIRINKKIKYDVLCVHYSIFTDKVIYKKTCYNKKTKKCVDVIETVPITLKGKSDIKFNTNGIDQGLGYRWYPRHSFW